MYRPDPDRADAYDALYAEYRELHDHVRPRRADARLRGIRNAALAAPNFRYGMAEVSA